MPVIEMRTVCDIEVSDVLMKEARDINDTLRLVLHDQLWRVEYKGRWWLAFGPPLVIRQSRSSITGVTSYTMMRGRLRPTTSKKYQIGEVYAEPLRHPADPIQDLTVMKMSDYLLNKPAHDAAIGQLFQNKLISKEEAMKRMGLDDG